MTVLAIDLGRAMGWAVATDEAVEAWPRLGKLSKGPIEGVTYGTHHFKSRQAKLWVETSGMILEMISYCKCNAVAFESPTPNQRSLATARSLIGQATAVEMACYHAKVRVGERATNSIRLHFTGSGKNDNKTKQRVLDTCAARGWTPEDNNAADALAILDYAIHAIYPKP